MEKRNSQCEHGQPKEQTRSLFFMCNLDVAHCQSQRQCHIWRIIRCSKQIARAIRAWQLSIKFCVIHEAVNGCKILKIHLRLALKM